MTDHDMLAMLRGHSMMTFAPLKICLVLARSASTVFALSSNASPLCDLRLEISGF